MTSSDRRAALSRFDVIRSLLQNPVRVYSTLKALLSNAALIQSALREKALIETVLAERSFIEDVLSEREVVARCIDRHRRLARALETFRAEFDELAAQTPLNSQCLPLRWDDRYPCLDDRMATTPIDRHYLYHPAWAARVLAKTRPKRHIDISSTVNFCAIVSAFIPVDFYDFRPAPIVLDGLHSGAADLTALPFADGTIFSLSCMHVLEHIGLGRYGEPLDHAGDQKAIRELVRVLAPGGNLLVATPVGEPRIQFNAHRVYDYEAFLSYFEPLQLIEFALIKEHGDEGLVTSPPRDVVRAQKYGCGCFWLRKN